MLLTVLLSAGAAIALVYGYYLPAFALAGLICWNTVYFFRHLSRSANELRRLMNAIRFSEFNISFRQAADRELAAEMESVVEGFGEKMQLREAERNFYDILLNRIDFAIVVADRSGRIEWINKRALDLVGNPRPCSISDMDRLSPGFSSLLDNLTPKDIKTVKVNGEDPGLDLVVTMAVINVRGESMKVFSLKNMKLLLDEAESVAWEKLVHVLTHEIMNSIAPIVSLSESFSGEDAQSDPQTMSRAIETIHRRSKGLIKFVGDYKRLTHIPPPEKELFNIAEMMNDIASLLKAQDIVFSCGVTPTDLRVKADKAQLEQVVINLIKNAWEAGIHKQSDPMVTVDVRQDEYRRPIIAVADNGCGILPEAMDKLFIPFFTTKKEGSGIGLSICRQIITAHGGTIVVTSGIDQGSVFTVRL